MRRIAVTAFIAGAGLVAPARMMAQGFGGAVAVAGNDVLVGATSSNKRPGVVYLYQRDAAGNWAERAELTAPDSTVGDRFGAALAVRGDAVAVGAPGHADGVGAVYLLRREGGRWIAGRPLVSPDSGGGFGSEVALGADWLAVGAPESGDSARGAVFLFRRAGDRWDAAGTLRAPDTQPNDGFGSALTLVGDWLVVGAPGRNQRTGTAFVFAPDGGGGWRLEGQLAGGGLDNGARFGTVVGGLGSLVLVGAPRQDRLIGAVYVFVQDAGSGAWNEAATLKPFDGMRGTQFGTSLGVDGKDLWVGAPGQGGHLYRYAWDSAAAGWSGVTKLGGVDLKGGSGFGSTVAVGASVAVAGATREDYGAGAAVVLERGPDGAWTPRGRIASQITALPAITGGEVACAGGKAAMFTCDGVNVESFLPVQAIGGARGIELNDLWGWTDGQTGKEYALVGRMDGTSFIDVSDALHPVYLGDLPMTDSANASFWRDIKVYKDHAYIVSDGAGPHGMQVFDLRQLRRVRTPPVTFKEAVHYYGVASAHNIVINESTGVAFIVGSSGGGETCGGGLHMVDIKDPEKPVFAGCFAQTGTGRRGTGYTHDAQCVTYHGPDAQYRNHEICFGANETAISIADVTDKANPKGLSTASYPNVAYTHQGWLTEDQRYFYLDDELDELSGTVAGTRTLIWDVADLDDPVLLGEYISTNHSIDHNLYIRGNLMYQSNYVSGLRVFDISDRAHPVPVGFFDTVPWGNDEPRFDGSWSNYPFFKSGIVVVTSGAEGVFVLRKQQQTLVP